MSNLFAAVKITNSAAVIAAKRNADQQRLIQNVPTMIGALTVLVDRHITNGKTHEMLESFLRGYNQYGRLRPNMLATLQDVILQNSDALLKIVSEAQSQEPQPQPQNTVSESDEAQCHAENDSDPDEDPFA